MRTQEEIVKFVEEHKDNMFFGMVLMDVLQHLTYEHAKPYLKEEVTKEQWENDGFKELEREFVLQEMGAYLNFAFNKAANERGLSAARSLFHYGCWTFLLGDEGAELHAAVMGDYEGYGIPQLRKIEAFLKEKDKELVKSDESATTPKT